MAYAGTTVPVERSQAQLRKLLQHHGASSFEFGEGALNGQLTAAVGFAIHGLHVRMRVPLKAPGEQAVRAAAARSKRGADEARATLVEQESKRIWRVLAWNVKARLESVEEGVETLEEAFLAHVLDETSGETIFEQLTRTGRVELDAPLQRELERGD
jgi:hypothetical protein